MRVDALMTSEVKTCYAQDSVHTAARLMWENDLGCLPVVDEEAHVVGMITDRDVCMASYTAGRPLWEISVAEPMCRTIWSCRPFDEVAAVASTMKERKVRRVPVLDAQGRVVGLITLSDIAREAVRTEKKKRRLRDSGFEVAETLAAICEPGSSRLRTKTRTGSVALSKPTA